MPRTYAPTRRDAIQAGLFGLLGVGLSARPLRANDGTATKRGRAKSCILVYLLGGPAHQDMWDLKPQAPAEVRGVFAPIATAVPGIQICEHLPCFARLAHRFAIVRSVTYPNHDHPFMTYYTLTGRVSPVPLGENTVLAPSRNDFPHIGSVVAKLKHHNGAVPGYVAIPEVRVRMQAAPVSGGGRAGFLGPSFDPFPINDDPTQLKDIVPMSADVSGDRLRQRETLLATLEGCAPHSRAAEEHDVFRQSALRLSGEKAYDLFAVEREPDRLRQRYGLHRFGQSMLLARRLVERGVSLVGIHFNYMSKCDGWDTHAKNFDCLKGELLPLLDQGLSALLEDLSQRGLLDETLVVCMGEFGRTPKINANAGRDHWGHCASVVLAGGGVRGGQVIGSSDRNAAYPNEFPFDPADIQASLYYSLGVDPEQEMMDMLQKPVRLSTGKVIDRLF